MNPFDYDSARLVRIYRELDDHLRGALLHVAESMLRNSSAEPAERPAARVLQLRKASPKSPQKSPL
jgi:hypothetical protein